MKVQQTLVTVSNTRLSATLMLLIVSISLVLTSRVKAQAVGEIVGTVTDPSGAVISDARITAIRVETGVSQSTISSSAGTYAIPNLLVGTYSLRVEKEGFRPATANGVTLDVSQQRQVDFKLSLGAVESSVEVNTAPPLLNTTNATLEGLVSEQQVQTLPLNGRNIGNLVTLQPGMAQDTGSMGWLAPQWISNGNRGETSVATLDGGDATDSEMGTIQFANFNLDAISEFKVLQLNYSAEYGQGGGTITQIVSKSGTNQFHGSVFEFVRNNAFDARNYFATTVPPFQRNEFGGTFGGPIRKGKTFFFAQYAGFRQRLAEPAIMAVPTAQQRQGIVTITGTQYPGTYQIPLNSVAQQILGKYPIPNQPNGLFGANTYNALIKQPWNMDQVSARVDHKFSEKDSIFGRFSWLNNTQKEQDPVAAAENPSFSAENYNDPRNISASETHIFTPTLINTGSFTLNRQLEGSVPPTQEFTQSQFVDGSLSTWGPDTFVAKIIDTYYNFEDKLNWNKGRHALTFGGGFRVGSHKGYGVTSAGPNGFFAFGPGTALPQGAPSTVGGSPLPAGAASPSGMVSMMEGVSQYYERSTTIPGFGPAGGGGAWFDMHIWHLASYLQDDMRVGPKLTLNLGLRYEFNSVPTEIGNRYGQPSDRPSTFGDFLLNPSPIYPPDRLNFAPRFGMAYKVDDKTVLRSGFAIFTNLIPTVYPDQALFNFPMAALSFAQNATYSLTPQSVSLPQLYSLSGQPMPPSGGTKAIPPNTPVDLTPISQIIGQIGGDYPGSKLRNGYTMSSNLTLERELPGSAHLQASYVMSIGVKLYMEEFPNAFTGALPQNQPYTQVTPALGEILLVTNSARSFYNALQLQARKNLSRRLQFQANYTYSKVTTDADAVWSAPGASGGVTQNNPQCVKCEWAPATYSLKHRFVGNFEYDLPGMNRYSRLTQGWKTLGIFSAQSGFPFTVVGPYGTYQYGFDSFDGVGARPFFVKQATYAPSGGPQFFSTDLISNPSSYFSTPTITLSNGNVVQTAPGDTHRNMFVGPSWWNLDFSLIKDTNITETKSLQFRAEFFNLFNHSTFATPNGTITNPSFGLSTSTATPERQIQFGARLIF